MNASMSLKVALAKKGIKQSAIGTMIGVSPTAVSRLATQPNWTCDSLQRVADALGMKVSEFVALGED